MRCAPPADYKPHSYHVGLPQPDQNYEQPAAAPAAPAELLTPQSWRPEQLQALPEPARWAFSHLTNPHILPVVFDATTHNKKPIFKWDDAITRPDDARWADLQHITMWAVLTKPSWLCVIDCDVDKAANVSTGQLNWVEKVYKAGIYDAPTPFMVRTGSGGMHLWYFDGDPARQDGHHNFKTCTGGSRDGKDNTGGPAPMVDVRAGGAAESRGGMIILPGSYYRLDGQVRRYDPVDADAQIPQVPDSIAALLTRAEVARPVPVRQYRKSQRMNFDVMDRLHDLMDEIRSAPQGTRNSTFSHCAGKAFRYASELSELTIHNMLRDAAAATGMRNSEIEATLRSAARWGLAHQREPRKWH